MERIDFNNNNLPSLSEQILEALQDNIEQAIKTQVKKELLLDQNSGASSGAVLNGNVDNYDLIIVHLGNVGNSVESQTRVIPVCAGVYRDFFYLYASSAYNSAILVDLTQKNIINLGVRNPVRLGCNRYKNL